MTTSKSTEVTITVRADDARLMGEALYEMRRAWADAADEAEAREDRKGAGYERMREHAADRIAGTLHEAGWNAAGHVSAATAPAQGFELGDRVEFVRDYELGWLGVLVSADEQGVVTDVADGISIRMDRDYGEALEGWDNEIVFSSDDEPDRIARFVRKV